MSDATDVHDTMKAIAFMVQWSPDGVQVITTDALKDILDHIATLNRERDKAREERDAVEKAHDANVLWMRQVLKDHRIGFDDHPFGRRAALSDFLFDTRTQLAAARVVTDAMVERAAKAMWEGADGLLGMWSKASEQSREHYHDLARRALTAALRAVEEDV
jgi:hypothetical protein